MIKDQGKVAPCTGAWIEYNDCLYVITNLQSEKNREGLIIKWRFQDVTFKLCFYKIQGELLTTIQKSTLKYIVFFILGLSFIITTSKRYNRNFFQISSP